MLRPTVLFVDDEAHVTSGLKRAMHRASYRILTAQSANDALAIMAQQSVDVLVADEKMPGISGSEMLAIARRDFPQTMRVILTGHATIEAAKRAVNEGQLHRFLTKPCTAAELSEAIEGVLRQKDLTADANIVIRALEADAQAPW